jgi:hypothetical protein
MDSNGIARRSEGVVENPIISESDIKIHLQIMAGDLHS